MSNGHTTQLAHESPVPDESDNGVQFPSRVVSETISPDARPAPPNVSLTSVNPRVEPVITSSNPLVTGPTRVPGTYPPDWLPDHEADACMACDSQFTIIKRRHHCRSCGKIFCADCCRLKQKLLYLDNREARVCNDCHHLIEISLSGTILNQSSLASSSHTQALSTSNLPSTPGGSQASAAVTRAGSITRIQGLLKSNTSSGAGAGHSSRGTLNQTSNTSSSSVEQHTNKQVMFSDGIRPGTDLTEQGSNSGCQPASSSSGEAMPGGSAGCTLLTRQNRTSNNSDSCDNAGAVRKSKHRSHSNDCHKNVTVCDELGFLPPIIISNESPLANDSTEPSATSSSSQLASMIISQFKSTMGRKTIQASMESRSCPLNGEVKFDEISALLGVRDVVTFLLLKDFYLKVKLVTKSCCIDKTSNKDIKSNCINRDSIGSDLSSEIQQATSQVDHSESANESIKGRRYWCFTSVGLDRFGQNEIVLVLDKDPEDDCVPRDVFKIYLTLHELALRRQALENLGNLLFQDGLFGSRDTAGLIFVRPIEGHCLQNLIVPEGGRSFLFALVLQRWEVPWSKVFPMRLLLRLGHKFDTYPYPIVSFRKREPVYYEVGHTIISILGDFRNFRYSLTHVDGLKVMINKHKKKVTVQLVQSNYQQFNKVLDSSNNEHVLAWSSCPFPEAIGHLVSIQTDDGQYETVEFLRETKMERSISFKSLEENEGQIIGASFVIFSGALKVNQTGQPAKISIVEDGLLIQIQSCTMTALKNAIHFMHHFDIDCENNQDSLNRVEIDWLPDDI